MIGIAIAIEGDAVGLRVIRIRREHNPLPTCVIQISPKHQTAALLGDPGEPGAERIARPRDLDQAKAQRIAPAHDPDQAKTQNRCPAG